MQHRIFLLGLVAIGAAALGTVSAVAGQSADTAPPSSTAPAGESDAAYVAPTFAEPLLPSLPARPTLDTESYPDCRNDSQKIEAPFDKASDINRCTALIDLYYSTQMLPYREAMIRYQEALSALYSDKVGGNMAYSPSTQDGFYKKIMAEHAASDPEGANQAGYRAIEAQYQTDRAYLADRYCFNTGCNGYAVPAYVAKPAEGTLASEDAKKKSGARKQAGNADADTKCKRARKRGGGFGSLLGGVVGNAAGLKNVGTVLAGALGGLLVSEIACQLDEKEQVVAAQATVEVTKKEEVGATSSWKSPTREGVSGSSIITALNTEPNGSKCLAITDIAIVEGEETRVSKRMCRKKPGEPYSIMA